jgi:hypothetical protein
LFNAFHDDYGFQPIFVFDGKGRFVTAMLRPGKRPSGHEIRGFVRRLVGTIRALWPKAEIPRPRSCCVPTAISCRGAGEEYRRTLHGSANARQPATLHAIL